MSAEEVFQRLMQPLSESAPCGQSLEDSPILAGFDAYRLFGQQTAIGPQRPGQNDNDPPTPPNWAEMREKSLEALATSKDLRVLAHLGAALLWQDGLLPFFGTLNVAAGWLETWFDAVYPRVDEDAFFRTNALNNFVDRLAIVDALRRTALVSNRQLGALSLRRMELATGTIPATPADSPPPTDGEIRAAFAEAPIGELRALVAGAEGALAALARIDAKMTAAGGVDATANFDGRSDKERNVSLRHQLKRIRDVVVEQIAARPDAVAAAGSSAGGADGQPAAAMVVGAIRSRQEAVRALDAVAAFFLQTEPSSPVPMFVERAKRLIAKNFLEVLQDIAPDALDSVKAVGGIRDKVES
jgi:type VI secretion system protein ImpA